MLKQEKRYTKKENLRWNKSILLDSFASVWDAVLKYQKFLNCGLLRSWNSHSSWLRQPYFPRFKNARSLVGSPEHELFDFFFKFQVKNQVIISQALKLLSKGFINLNFNLHDVIRLEGNNAWSSHDHLKICNQTSLSILAVPVAAVVLVLLTH